MAHDHHHHPALPGQGGRLALVVGLNVVITIAEIIGGILSGSLSLISDALHNFSDAVAVIIAWIAIRLNRRPRSDRYTFGLKRAELLAAVINAGSLVAISIYLFAEAWQRFVHPQPIAGALMIIVALIGLVANVAGTLLLRPGAATSLNLRAAYLHLLSDAVSSLGVILGGIAILVWNITWVDPLLTVLIAGYVLKESLVILWQTVGVILLAAPEGMALKDVRQAILEEAGVEDVHHSHLWQLTPEDIHFEGHIGVADQPLSAIDTLRDDIGTRLKKQFGITHVTLQFESARSACASGALQ